MPPCLQINTLFLERVAEMCVSELKHCSNMSVFLLRRADVLGLNSQRLLSVVGQNRPSSFLFAPSGLQLATWSRSDGHRTVLLSYKQPLLCRFPGLSELFSSFHVPLIHLVTEDSIGLFSLHYCRYCL